jgi:hypothetical protein
MHAALRSKVSLTVRQHGANRGSGGINPYMHGVDALHFSVFFNEYDEFMAYFTIVLFLATDYKVIL